MTTELEHLVTVKSIKYLKIKSKLKLKLLYAKKENIFFKQKAIPFR